AWMLFALGAAARLAPLLERDAASLRRRLRMTLPGLLGVVLVLAGIIVGGDSLAKWREDARPLPPGDPPNVLLITLDTVRADHLSLYGYQRPTSPNFEKLARLGVRFDAARAAAPWTVPSHATMFTGRWPSELSADWTTPLDGKHPTLAEHLG